MRSLKFSDIGRTAKFEGKYNVDADEFKYESVASERVFVGTLQVNGRNLLCSLGKNAFNDLELWDDGTIANDGLTVRLLGYDSHRKLNLVKVVKNASGMSLMEAKRFVEQGPNNFSLNLTEDQAEKLKRELQDAGATCEIIDFIPF